MSLPSIKYNANQEELEEFLSSEASNSAALETSDNTKKTKKQEKAGVSIIDKYLKAFKPDKPNEEDAKSEARDVDCAKDNTVEKKTLDSQYENSGSPIKEYFSKFNKRSDSVDTNSDVESSKDSKDKDVSNNDRWKLFSDFRDKIAQAVEDIKSSRTPEGTEIRDKQGLADNASVTDSEENSLIQDIDQNSCASTENQVSSLASSVQNLSELSLPVISHSSTMTDTEMEMTSSSDTNQNVTETADSKKKQKEPDKVNLTSNNSSMDDEEMEIESGVDALEDFDLVTKTDGNVVTEADIISGESSNGYFNLTQPSVTSVERDSFVSYSMIFITSSVVLSLIICPKSYMFNGFLMGIWCTYMLNRLNAYILEYLGYNSDTKKLKETFLKPDFSKMPMARMPKIVEFEPLKKYEGWINIYMLGKYDPLTYHISFTQTAFMKLEGSTLRLSFTHNKVPKRALWNEELHKVPFYQHRIYNLEGANIKLLPGGIVKKRHWSKKYPICLSFCDKSKMTVYNAQFDLNDATIQQSGTEPSLPLFSKEEADVPHSEKQNAASDQSVSEVSQSGQSDEKENQDDDGSQHRKRKSSPKKIINSFIDKHKTLHDTPNTSLEKDSYSDSVKGSPQSRTPRKPFLIKAIKEHLHSKKKQEEEKDLSSFLIDPASDFPDLYLDDDDSDEDPPVIRERHHSNNSNDYSDTENDRLSLQDFKDVLAVDKNNKMPKEDEVSYLWSKDDLDDGGSDEIILYLFGRTGRDKDEWYRRLQTAIEDADKAKNLELAMNENVSEESYIIDYLDRSESTETFDGSPSRGMTKKDNVESKVRVGSMKSDKKLIGNNDAPSVLWTPAVSNKESLLTDAFQSVQEVDFWRYMKDVLEANHVTEIPNEKSQYTGEVLWLNAIIGRIIFDTFRNQAWVSMLQERIQKKLSSLKLPSFMGPLVVTALDLGGETPRLHGASIPMLDSQGLWVDLQISYSGHANMTLTTQLNLMSLKDKREKEGEEPLQHKSKTPGRGSGSSSLAVYDSDLEDTAESSSEDDTPLAQPSTPKTVVDADTAAPSLTPNANSSTKKLLRMVDKIASNKYFQHVTEYKYVKRAMEGVSNTDLKLSVELLGLVGCLTLNIPPPPSDRIWFGFRGNPELWLKAKPVVGARVINFSHITSWIEKRLCTEFEKLLVLPNMEDLNLDCMTAPVI